MARIALACAIASTMATTGCGGGDTKPAVTRESATTETAAATPALGAGEAMLAVPGGSAGRWLRRGRHAPGTLRCPTPYAQRRTRAR